MSTPKFEAALSLLKPDIERYGSNTLYRHRQLAMRDIRTYSQLKDLGFEVDLRNGGQLLILQTEYNHDVESLGEYRECLGYSNAVQFEEYKEWLSFRCGEGVAITNPTLFLRKYRTTSEGPVHDIVRMAASLHNYIVLNEMHQSQVEHEYQSRYWEETAESDLRRRIDRELRDGIDIDDVPFDWAKLRELCEWMDDSFDIEKAVEFAIDFYKEWLERIRPDAERAVGSTELVLQIRELINNCNAAWPCEREEALDQIFELLKA